MWSNVAAGIALAQIALMLGAKSGIMPPLTHLHFPF